jgi:hypothetical protein
VKEAGTLLRPRNKRFSSLLGDEMKWLNIGIPPNFSLERPVKGPPKKNRTNGKGGLHYGEGQSKEETDRTPGN